MLKKNGPADDNGDSDDRPARSTQVDPQGAAPASTGQALFSALAGASAAMSPRSMLRALATAAGIGGTGLPPAAAVPHAPPLPQSQDLGPSPFVHQLGNPVPQPTAMAPLASPSAATEGPNGTQLDNSSMDDFQG